MNETSIVRRAFELARSGSCRSVADIRAKLKAEGYWSVTEHLDGQSIQRQLRCLINASLVQTDASKLHPDAPVAGYSICLSWRPRRR